MSTGQKIETVQLLDKKDYCSKLQQLVTDIKKLTSSDHFVIKHNDNPAYFTHNTFKALLSYKTEDGIRSSVRDMLIEASKLSRGHGGDECLTSEFMISLLSELLKHSFYEKSSADSGAGLSKDIDGIKLAIKKHRMDPSPSQAYEILRKTLNSETIANIITTAYELSGLNGRIFIEKKNGNDITVELVPGSTFNINIPPAFFMKENKWKAKNVKCLLIDGIIERVSEIHGILEKSNETKEPVLLCCTGFSEEVIATLHTNFLRKTLNVIPARISTGLDGINMLNDIASACGCDVVSSFKGQVISAVKYDELAIVDSVVCTHNGAVISNQKTFSAVNSHIKRLIEKRDKQSVDDVNNIYNTRIKALASSRVIIGIPSESKFSQDKLEEEIDKGILLYKNLIGRGYVSVGALLDEADCNIQSSLRNALETFRGRSVATNSLIASLHFGISNAELLFHVSSALALD